MHDPSDTPKVTITPMTCGDAPRDPQPSPEDLARRRARGRSVRVVAVPGGFQPQVLRPGYTLQRAWPPPPDDWFRNLGEPLPTEHEARQVCTDYLNQ